MNYNVGYIVTNVFLESLEPLVLKVQHDGRHVVYF